MPIFWVYCISIWAFLSFLWAFCLDRVIDTYCRQMSRIRAINMGAREKPNTNLAIVTTATTKQSVTLEKSPKPAKMKALSLLDLATKKVAS